MCLPRAERVILSASEGPQQCRSLPCGLKLFSPPSILLFLALAGYNFLETVLRTCKPGLLRAFDLRKLCFAISRSHSTGAATAIVSSACVAFKNFCVFSRGRPSEELYAVHGDSRSASRSNCERIASIFESR